MHPVRRDRWTYGAVLGGFVKLSDIHGQDDLETEVERRAWSQLEEATGTPLGAIPEEHRTTFEAGVATGFLIALQMLRENEEE